MRAELNRCVDILGRAPDVCGMVNGDSPFARAMKKVAEEYGMVYNFGHKMHVRPDGHFDHDPVDPKWEDAKLLHH